MKIFDDDMEGVQKMYNGKLNIINGRAAYLKHALVQNSGNTSKTSQEN